MLRSVSAAAAWSLRDVEPASVPNTLQRKSQAAKPMRRKHQRQYQQRAKPAEIGNYPAPSRVGPEPQPHAVANEIIGALRRRKEDSATEPGNLQRVRPYRVLQHCIGNSVKPISFRLRTQRPVRIDVIDKQVFVEAADLFDGRKRYQRARRNQEIDRQNFAAPNLLDRSESDGELSELAGSRIPQIGPEAAILSRRPKGLSSQSTMPSCATLS